MLSLIIVFLFALGVAYFAIQNTLTVSIIFANSVFHNVPIYLLVIGSIIVGIILASVINSLDSLSAYMKLRGKDSVIHTNERAITELQQKVHDLEIENAQLKSTHNHDIRHIATTNEDEVSHRKPTLFGELLHPHVKA